MAASRFNLRRLAQLLQPHGFTLNLSEAFKRHFGDFAIDDTHSYRALLKVVKGNFSFVRPSTAPRLHEHIRVFPPPGAYADAIVSAATFVSCHASVSEVDSRLRAFLSNGSSSPASHVATVSGAADWMKRLADNAGAFCGLAATDFGPLLCERLQPAFHAVDQYECKLGDFCSLFDREFAFLAEATAAEKSKSDYLAERCSRGLYLNPDDAKLASLAMVRFGNEVEKVPSWYSDSERRFVSGFVERMILLTDLIGRRRRQ